MLRSVREIAVGGRLVARRERGAAGPIITLGPRLCRTRGVAIGAIQTGGLGRAMQILERDLTGEPGERGVIVAHAERGFSHDGAGWQRIVELLCDIIGGALVAALIGKPGVGEQRFEPFLGIERRFRSEARAGEQRARLSVAAPTAQPGRSEEHTSELQSLMRISYAVF